MKKTLLALAISATIAAPAFADTTAAASSTLSAGQEQGQQQAALAGASNEGNHQDITFTSPEKAKVEYSGDYTVKNVPNVAGPALTSSNDTCMGSTSGGVAGAGFGVSLGSTWTDGNCKMLKNSRELWNMGMRAAALALMCKDSDNKDALEVTGFTCPTKDEKKSAQAAPAAPTAAADQAAAPIQTASADAPKKVVIFGSEF